MRREDPIKWQRAKELRRAMTPAERDLWQKLRTNRLGGFHSYRQVVLHGFIADFYCPAVRLVVEVDGNIHRQQVEYDAERDAVLTGAGLTVHRISNEDVQQHLPDVLNRLLTLCRAAPDHHSPH